MQSRNMLLAGMAALSCAVAGCEKPAGDAAVDTATAPAAAAADRSADERAIIALDSGWVRQVLAKNVDSLMTYYAPDAVSYGFAGSGAASGIDQLRAGYTEMVKATMTNPTMSPGAGQVLRRWDNGVRSRDLLDDHYPSRWKADEGIGCVSQRLEKDRRPVEARSGNEHSEPIVTNCY